MFQYTDVYSTAEKRSYKLHLAFAILCLPLYILMSSTFGLIISPYLVFLALNPKPQYLLPVIIHMAYGSQQRAFFCLGCFIYVMIHFGELRKYSLGLLYALYVALLPFFIWYVIEKYNGPRFVGGIGEVTGGLSEYLAFSAAFWGAIAIKKIGREFILGLLGWSVFLVFVVSFKTSSDSIMSSNIDIVGGISLFSREVFFAIPFLWAALYAFWFREKRKFTAERSLATFGCFLLLLDALHILKYSLTFTQLGLCMFACLMVYLSKYSRRKVLVALNPIFFFAVSLVVVLYSAQLVEKYGGLYSDMGTYDEMKVDSLDSFFKKLQRKTVDDRAFVWQLNLQHISKLWHEQPIFVDTSPVIKGKGIKNGQTYDIETIMGAHNTLLQLLRQYGFYGGLGLYLIFIAFFCKKDTTMFLSRNGQNPIVALMATCVAEGVIGGHTGHYPIQIGFSPVVFSCMGACWRIINDSRIFRTNGFCLSNIDYVHPWQG